jgi:hypothetical protein
MQSGVVTLGQVAARLATLAVSCNRRGWARQAQHRPAAGRAWRQCAGAGIAPP